MTARIAAKNTGNATSAYVIISFTIMAEEEEEEDDNLKYGLILAEIRQVARCHSKQRFLRYALSLLPYARSNSLCFVFIFPKLECK